VSNRFVVVATIKQCGGRYGVYDRKQRQVVAAGYADETSAGAAAARANVAGEPAPRVFGDVGPWHAFSCARIAWLHGRRILKAGEPKRIQEQYGPYTRT
jgi:hypothetical protein